MFIGKSIIEAVFQVVLFTLIPFLYYLIRKKKAQGFLEYLGFVRPPQGWLGVILKLFFVATLLSVLPMVYFSLSGSLESDLLATNQFSNTTFGIGYLLEVVIYAVIKTSLSEEIFFRGFLGKRLIGKFGFRVGNAIQATLFGLIHGLIFIQYGVIAVALSILLTSSIGYMLGWVNERRGEGSIFLSWAIHALANILSPIVLMLWL